MTKIPVWQMIHEAVNAMTKEVFSVDDIRSYPDQLPRFFNVSIMGSSCSVARPSKSVTGTSKSQ